MKRSSLSTKFTPKRIIELERWFKEKYKKENGEPFKGNAIIALTYDLLMRKGMPDLEDIYVVGKAGNNNATDEEFDLIYQRWMENEENRKRGRVGALCDLMTDLLVIDDPINSNVTKMVLEAEGIINKRLEDKGKYSNELTDIINKLKDSLTAIGNKEESKDVDGENKEVKEDTQE